jgi:hypothetical protein
MSTTPATTRKTTRKTAAPAPTENAKSERTKKLAEARTAAIATLLAKHRDEFNTLMEQEAKDRNVEWKRTPTPAEKRRAALKALLEEDPSLIDEVRNLSGLHATGEPGGADVEDPDRTTDLGGDPVTDKPELVGGDDPTEVAQPTPTA